MVGYLLTSLLQLYCRAWWWKNFENRLTFRRVTGKNKVAPFFRTRCIYTSLFTKMVASKEKKRKKIHTKIYNKQEIYNYVYTNFGPFIWKIAWIASPLIVTPNFGSTAPRWSEIADFEPILTRSASAVTPSEKSSINISPLRACQWAKDDHLTLLLSP